MPDNDPPVEVCDHLLGEWQGCDEGGTFSSEYIYPDDMVEEYFKFCPRCGVPLNPTKTKP